MIEAYLGNSDEKEKQAKLNQYKAIFLIDNN